MRDFIFIKTMPLHFGFEHFLNVSLPINEVKSIQSEANGDFNTSHPDLIACYVLLEEKKALGRFAFYHNKNLSYQEKTAICLGSYQCDNDDEAASFLLNKAQEEAVNLGFNYIIGPMNGSTWENYRFNRQQSNESFLMDINLPIYYNDQFQKTGFEPISSYVSNIDNSLEHNLERLDKMQKYYQGKGAIIKPIDMSNLERDLYRIAVFCNIAFRKNFLFTPIRPEDFVEKYIKIRDYLDPDFVSIVENRYHQIEGLFFALPDPFASSEKTLIIKTIACRPHSTFRGISTYLVRKANQLAAQKGYKKIIHAFMKTDNLSQNASKNLATTLHQEYALYGLDLAKNHRI